MLKSTDIEGAILECTQNLAKRKPDPDVSQMVTQTTNDEQYSQVEHLKV